MKKKILVADRDYSLKEAFRVIFSDDQYEILYAQNGKEAEKLAEENRPEIYIVNVDLAKYTGIEVYKKLQKEKYLENARFFFLKDENDSTALLGFQAEGVIEKPINFFKVHERIHREEDILELTDVVEEAQPVGGTEPTETFPDREEGEGQARVEAPAATEPVATGEPNFMEEPTMEQMRTADNTEVPANEALEQAATLETEVRSAFRPIMEDMAKKLTDAMAPAVSRYIEDYTRRILFEIAEKVIREEIEKLLKESTDFPGK